jgi:hypothetical protein
VRALLPTAETLTAGQVAVWEVLGVLFEALGNKRRPREAFELRVSRAMPGSAAAREDFTHCWTLENTGVKSGARDVTFAWRRGPDGKPGEPIELGSLPLLRTVPLDGIPWPSQRPPVSAQVNWTQIDGGRRKMTVDLD